MSDDVQPAVTIVVDPTGLEASALRRLVAMVDAAAEGVAYDISLATESGPSWELDGSTLAWLESLAHVTLSTHESIRPSWRGALNTAVAAARHEVVLILEKALTLPPRCMGAILEQWLDEGVDWLSIPVRDEAWGVRTHAHADPAAVRDFYAEGAAILCRPGDFLRVRGYDERPELAGFASTDLRVRFNRAGMTCAKVRRVAAYRSEGAAPAPTPSAAEIKERVSVDGSIYRNLTSWSVPRELRPVLVSVAIATRDRATYLRDSINSILNQTFQDFEIILVDDGSTDDTKDVVDAIEDPRIRYLYRDRTGISAARNCAADESRGFLTAVHDDDDIMLPDRLEVGLKSLSEEYDASYGSWVNFDNDSARLVLHVIRDRFNPDLVAFNGQGPGHSTWLVPTDLLRLVRYDETYSASVDHNLATRMAWAGCRWVHTGRVAYLRRIHPTQVSITDGGNQKIGHVLTRFLNEFVASQSGRTAMRKAGSDHENPTVPGRENLSATFGAWLPDHLVKRTAVFRGDVSNKLMKLARYPDVQAMLTERDLDTRRLHAEMGIAKNITWDDMVRLRTQGESTYELSTVVLPTLDDDAGVTDATAAQVMRDHLDHLITSYPLDDQPVWFVVWEGLPADDQAHFEAASRRSRVVVASSSERYFADVFGFRNRRLLAAAPGRMAELVASGRVLVVDPLARTPAQAAASAAFILGQV